MFFNIFYNILIYPIEFIIEILFYLFNNVFKSGYGLSLFFLSLCINFLSLPLYNIAESWQAKERAIQDKMKPMIDNIKAVYKGDQRYLLIRACQRINGYKTIYAFRGTLGLLIQIPFFMAAYNFVHSLTGLNGQSFLFIKDLSKPDALIHIGSISINLLPFLMTLFSLLAGFVYAKKLKFKESLPLYIVSLIFLVLLYTSPSGLLFYWTINCLFSLIKNIVIEYKLYNVFVKNKLKLLNAYNIFVIILSVIFIIFLILGNIEREGYLKDFNLINNGNVYNIRIGYYSSIFKNSDIYGVTVNKDKLDNRVINIEFGENGSPFGIVTLNDTIENIGELKVYYKLFIKSDIVFYFVLLLIICLLLNIPRFINTKLFNFNNLFYGDSFLKNRNKLILLSCLVITLLSGLFIPSSLIGNSPQEFREPFYLIFNDLSMSIGLFLFYPFFIYLLFSEKIKNILTAILICSATIVLINTFIMVGNYININADFVFDNTDLLKASLTQTTLNLLLILVSIFIIFFILFKKKYYFIINIYIVVIIALVSISVIDIRNIIIFKNQSNKNIAYDTPIDKKIFNLSKSGENIFLIILDRAASPYWYDAFERYPEYKTMLNGFEYFPNNVSLCEQTVGIAPLYGGYDYLPYEFSTNSKLNITNNHNEALLTVPLALEKYGYKTIFLDPTYPNFSISYNTTIFDNHTNIKTYSSYIYKYSEYYINNYFNNIYENKKDNNKMKKILRFSLFRMMPINTRYTFYGDKTWFMSSDNNINTSILHYSLMSSIKDSINITNDNSKYYNIFHSDITHEPLYYNFDYLPDFTDKTPNKYDINLYKDNWSVRHFYCNISSLNLIIELLSFLKKNDVYNNTKIIIVSDHGAPVFTKQFGSNSINAWYNALLLYKDFNSEGELRIDTNFSTIADVPYLLTKHINGIKNPFTGNLITNDYKTNGVYMVHADWDPRKQYSNRYNFNYYYYVRDDIFDTNNWKIFKWME